MRPLLFAALVTAPVAALHAQDLPIAKRATATLEVPGFPDFLALDRDGAWITNEGRVERWLPNGKRPAASVAVPEPCGAMAVDFASLWVADCRDRVLLRIGLASSAVEGRIATGLADPHGELSLATGAGSVWVLSDSSGVLTRVDPATNRIVATIPVAARSYAAVFGFDAVWITSTTTPGQVQRIDPATNRVVATIGVGPMPRFLAAGAGGVWTLNQGDGTVSRIDPRSNTLAATVATNVPGPGGDIAAGGNRVWVRATKILLSEIDPETNKVVRRYGPPAGSGAVRATAIFVWVTAHDVRRIWILPARD